MLVAFSHKITTFGRMKSLRIFLTLAFALTILLGGCKNSVKPQEQADTTMSVTDIPDFDADSAYEYVATQVAFGYRIPGSDAHKRTADWLVAQLQKYGAEVVTQQTVVTAFDGTRLPICNIIGQYAPEKKNRILLLAHWDSRPYADYDPDPSFRRRPIDGANDGASGVGVLLETARIMSERQPEIGVDILLVDAEDYGAPEWAANDDGNTWALGSQYWATHPHKPGYRARYGILLDMVGSRDAVFYREQISQYYAPGVLDKVWNCAERLGYGHLFVKNSGGAITDDHLYINQAGIPTIDIIHYDPDSPTGFPKQWHTRDDNMQHIDRNTLKAVGQTLLTVIYEEK